MPDPIPQGYITLPEAFERYFKHKFGSDEVHTERGGLFAFGRLGEPKLHSTRCELVSAFSAGDLEAYVRFPDKAENVRLLSDGWRELDYADRLFMSDSIPDHFSDTPWGSFRDRTPFVSEQALNGWLARDLSSQHRPDSISLDPMEEPCWPLGAAIAWIVWRTSGKVREEWNASLSGLALLEATNDDVSEDDGEKLVLVKAAREELWRRLAEGALTASAIKAESGRPVQIPAHEWAYLVRTADSNLKDQLRFNNTRLKVEYRDVMLNRDDVCRLWVPRQLDQAARGAVGSKAPVKERIALAANALWNGNVPAGLLAKERDNQIMQWLRTQGMRAPSERTLRGYFNSNR